MEMEKRIWKSFVVNAKEKSRFWPVDSAEPMVQDGDVQMNYILGRSFQWMCGNVWEGGEKGGKK